MKAKNMFAHKEKRSIFVAMSLFFAVLVSSFAFPVYAQENAVPDIPSTSVGSRSIYPATDGHIIFTIKNVGTDTGIFTASVSCQDLRFAVKNSPKSITLQPGEEQSLDFVLVLTGTSSEPELVTSCNIMVTANQQTASASVRIYGYASPPMPEIVDRSPATCGNSACDGSETEANCPIDCRIAPAPIQTPILETPLPEVSQDDQLLFKTLFIIAVIIGGFVYITRTKTRKQR